MMRVFHSLTLILLTINLLFASYVCEMSTYEPDTCDMAGDGTPQTVKWKV